MNNNKLLYKVAISVFFEAILWQDNDALSVECTD